MAAHPRGAKQAVAVASVGKRPATAVVAAARTDGSRRRPSKPNPDVLLRRIARLEATNKTLRASKAISDSSVRELKKNLAETTRGIKVEKAKVGSIQAAKGPISASEWHALKGKLEAEVATAQRQLAAEKSSLALEKAKVESIHASTRSRIAAEKASHAATKQQLGTAIASAAALAVEMPNRIRMAVAASELMVMGSKHGSTG